MTVKSLSHSSLEDNRFYRSMLVGNVPFEPYNPAFELLETQVLSTSASSVTFTGLGSYTDYKHLQVRTSLQAISNYDLYLRFNGSTTGYAYHTLQTLGVSVTSAAGSNASLIVIRDAIADNTTAQEYAGMVMDILDFSSSVKNTTTRSLSGTAGDATNITLTSGLWNNTSPVTQLTFTSEGNASFSIGSRFSLYGVK